ncbi:unnamed protein product, partial [Musa acuminata var. zebrina]
TFAFDLIATYLLVGVDADSDLSLLFSSHRPPPSPSSSPSVIDLPSSGPPGGDHHRPHQGACDRVQIHDPLRLRRPAKYEDVLKAKDSTPCSTSRPIPICFRRHSTIP